MSKKTPIHWNKIKAEYLQGATPKELGEKYKLTAKQISDKVNKEKWVSEKTKISENVRENVVYKVNHITNLALGRLEEVLTNEYVKTNDLISAIGKAIEISGLKSEKREITQKEIKIEVAKNEDKEILEGL